MIMKKLGKSRPLCHKLYGDVCCRNFSLGLAEMDSNKGKEIIVFKKRKENLNLIR